MSKEIFEAGLPLMNSYHVFPKKLILAIKTIKTLIKQPIQIVKKYVQVSSFGQHLIPSTS